MVGEVVTSRSSGGATFQAKLTHLAAPDAAAKPTIVLPVMPMPEVPPYAALVASVTLLALRLRRRLPLG